MTVQNQITIPDHEVIETLRRSAEILPSPDAPDFADVFERFGDARIVLLGEATHGTHEFYAARAAITRRLGVVKAILSLTVRAARLGG